MFDHWEVGGVVHELWGLWPIRRGQWAPWRQSVSGLEPGAATDQQPAHTSSTKAQRHTAAGTTSGRCFLYMNSFLTSVRLREVCLWQLQPNDHQRFLSDPFKKVSTNMLFIHTKLWAWCFNIFYRGHTIRNSSKCNEIKLPFTQHIPAAAYTPTWAHTTV